MTSAVREAEEEVFETPDIAEDDTLEAEMLSAGNEPLLTGNREVPDAEVLQTRVPPRAAFEVFMGKTYTGSREEDMLDMIGTSSLGVVGGGAVYAAEGFHGGGVEDGRGGTGLRRVGESPAQRLVRLREETAMLAEDLEEMSKATGRRPAGGVGESDSQSAADEGLEGGQEGGGRGDVDPSGYALWSAMAKETEALKRQLAQLSGDPKFKHIVSSPPYTRTAEGEETLQRRLSEGIVKALEALRLKEKERREDEGVAEPAPAAAGTSGSATSVTYELFLEEAAEARARSAGAAQAGGFSAVERRIAALEKAVGGRGGGGIARVSFGEKGQAAPLADAVASLERRVAVLEPGRLDAIRMKAQLAKAELDALTKSRAAVASATGPSASASATGSSISSPSLGDSSQRKVEEAFATLQSWQAVSDGLPALVDRLRALETLHLASASFAQRLEQLEGSQSELDGVLKSTSKELVATRESSAENVAIVEENIQALDGRLAGVGLS